MTWPHISKTINHRVLIFEPRSFPAKNTPLCKISLKSVIWGLTTWVHLSRNYPYGSIIFKWSRYGRGHGSDFAHIVFLNTLRHAKTKSEVLGPRLTWFGNTGRLFFFSDVLNCPTFFSITVYGIIGVDNLSFYFTYRSKIYQYLIIDIKILGFLVPLRSKNDLNFWSKVKFLF